MGGGPWPDTKNATARRRNPRRSHLVVNRHPRLGRAAACTTGARSEGGGAREPELQTDGGRGGG